jgi:hypothetical protein
MLSPSMMRMPRVGIWRGHHHVYKRLSRASLFLFTISRPIYSRAILILCMYLLLGVLPMVSVITFLQMKRIKVAEMKMLRFLGGYTYMIINIMRN